MPGACDDFRGHLPDRWEGGVLGEPQVGDFGDFISVWYCDFIAMKTGDLLVIRIHKMFLYVIIVI